ncbi:MAG: hypothetical protein R2744_08395 [Bacteroidales bacterium]
MFIKTKDPDSYPGIEEQVYAELTSMGWNILEKKRRGERAILQRR